jgi:hypothetical protein
MESLSGTALLDLLGVTFTVTGGLRIRLRSVSDEKGILQQEWINLRTGVKSWQDVPKVFEP